MIYTLEYLKKEAEGIAASWNGKSEHFTDQNGEPRTDEHAQAARELLVALKEVESLTDELGI